MNSKLLVRSVVVAAAAASISAFSALAQPPGGGGQGGGQFRMMFGGGGGPGGGGMAEPVMTSDQLGRYAGLLHLSPDQHDAAKALYDGYFASHQERAGRARQIMEDARDEFRESRDPAVFQEVGEKVRVIRDEGAKADKQLLDDIKSILTPDQIPGWTKVEQSLRRESGMRRSFISVSGERADVIAIAERIELPAEVHSQITPILDAYAEELDREIVKRDELRAKAEDNGQQMFRMFRPGGDGADPAQLAEADKMIQENRAAMVRVRDVNRKYARQLESVLPPEFASRFEAEFKRASFPEIYRSRYAANVIAAAEKMDLSDEQRASLQAIRDSYDRDGGVLNQRAEALQEETEASFSIQNMMNFGRGGNEQMQALRADRNKLEDSTVEKVKGLLTPEQQKALPERRDEGGERMGRRNRGDGGGGEQAQPQRRQRPGQGNEALPPRGG